ncbi:MAG: DUF885 family protein, partial [Burkholderiales bacterium]
LSLAALSLASLAENSDAHAPPAPPGYEKLVELFQDWRAFERPRLKDGAPDYTAAAFAKRHAELAAFRRRLAAIDTKGWPVETLIDHWLVEAEMNGFDFYVRVLKPWARDPAFYQTVWDEQSDTPAHEGTEHHAIVDVWTYPFPLSAESEKKLAGALAVIPPLNEQAKGNLTGNARDLWVTGAGTIRQQLDSLDALAKTTAGGGPALAEAIRAARASTAAFADWLDAEAPKKTGPSGIGRDNYSWSLQNVHLVPMTWDQEVTLLKRELARTHASLKLEEERNRGLPELPVIHSPEEYERRANQAVTRYLAFLEKKKLYPMRANMEPALRAKIGEYVPVETRNFFAIATHYEPLTLY